MTRKLFFSLIMACGVMAACDSSPTDAGKGPQYDVFTKPTHHTTTTTTSQSDTTAAHTDTGGNIGDPCDPETYQGPYRCIPNPNGQSGYIVAY